MNVAIDDEFLMKNENKLKDWNSLCKNKNAIKTIIKNYHKIDWLSLSINPAIFTYDYETIKNSREILNDELIKKSLNPKRLLRLMSLYGEDEIYNIYF
jgi:hypothetical protein